MVTVTLRDGTQTYQETYILAVHQHAGNPQFSAQDLERSGVPIAHRALGPRAAHQGAQALMRPIGDILQVLGGVVLVAS